MPTVCTHRRAPTVHLHIVSMFSSGSVRQPCFVVCLHYSRYSVSQAAKFRDEQIGVAERRFQQEDSHTNENLFRVRNTTCHLHLVLLMTI